MAETPEELFERARGSLRWATFPIVCRRSSGRCSSGSLKGTFAAIWEDILPPLPEALWRENLETVAAALRAGCHAMEM